MHRFHHFDTSIAYDHAGPRRGCLATSGMYDDFGAGSRLHQGAGSGAGRRGHRMFRQGRLRLMALHLLSERPRHGYELIKAIEELAGGGYSPSPGVIYPTLAWLADIGWARAMEQDGGRRQYAITPEGRAQLESQQGELQALLERLSGTRREAVARGAPEIRRAMFNLRTALHLRFGQGEPDPALTRRVAELIDQAAVGIERLEPKPGS